MKAVIAKPDGSKPCIAYWTGRAGFVKVGVLSYCEKNYDASDGVLQVPEDAPCCSECEEAVKAKRYPKNRRD